MVERIIPKTDALADRERRAIEDMRALFPDGNVSGLDYVDKALGKRLSKLYPALGYESRGDMIEALGFRQEGGNKGGRPVTTDPEAIIAELTDRYEGMEKPKTIGILIHDNPDLKGQIKTLQNKANEFFGQTLAKELKSRGLIGGGPKAEDITEGDIAELLEFLVQKYADAPIKPNSMAELKADNADKKAIIAAFDGRCRLIYGIAARKKLIELGVFEKPKGAVIDASDEEIERAIFELSELVMALDDTEKPKTISDLQKAYPELGEYIKAGNKKGLIDKGPLQQLGILAPTKALLKREGIRRAPAESLAEDYIDLGQPEVISPDDGSNLLPPYVVGVDIPAKLELREFLATIIGAAAKDISVGDKVAIDVAREKREWGDSYQVIRIYTAPLFSVELGPLSDDAVGNSGSPLSAFMGGVVVSVAHDDDRKAAQIRVRYLAELRNITLAYALRAIGVVTEKDVRGSMEWRYRIKLASRGKGLIAARDDAAKLSDNVDERIDCQSRSSAANKLTPLPRSDYNMADTAKYAFIDDPAIPDRLKEYLVEIIKLSAAFPRVRSADVVARAGCSKSTFSAALQKLKDAGCATVENGYIRLQEGARNKADGALVGYIDIIEELYLEPPRVRSADVVASKECSKSTFSEILQELKARKLVLVEDGYIMPTTNITGVSGSPVEIDNDGAKRRMDARSDEAPIRLQYKGTADSSLKYQISGLGVSVGVKVNISNDGDSADGKAKAPLDTTDAPPFTIGISSMEAQASSADSVHESTTFSFGVSGKTKQVELVSEGPGNGVEMSDACDAAEVTIPGEMADQSSSLASVDSELSSAGQNYFDAIAECVSTGQDIRSKELASIMGVSSAAVAKMLPKLKEADLIETDLDGYIKLTEKGYQLAGLAPLKEEASPEGYAFLTDPNVNASQRNYLKAIADISAARRVVRSIDIADALGVSKASVSKAIGNLEAAGLIEREGREIRLSALALGDGKPSDDGLESADVQNGGSLALSFGTASEKPSINVGFSSPDNGNARVNKADEKARQEREEAEALARREAEEKAKREAEERARAEAEEVARQAAEERERKAAEERARLEAEEQARKEAAEKAERERREREEEERAERERQEAEAERNRLQGEIVELEKKRASLERELTSYRSRENEIEQLEAKVKSLESEIASLGIFKGKEKKSKRVDLAQIMSQIASLKEQNVGLSRMHDEIAAADEQLMQANSRLDSLTK